MDRFAEVSSLPLLEIWSGVLGRAVHGAELTLSVIELEPRSVVPEHRHVNEQVGVLVSGSLTFRIGEESCPLTPGGMWVIPAGTPHEVTVGPDGAVAVEAFAPPRADWRGLPRRAGAVPIWPA